MNRDKKPSVGFIGLGQMGFQMASNVLKSGFPLQVYNRSKEKALPLIDLGASWAESPAAMAATCDVVVSMVSDDQALNGIVESSKGLLNAPKEGLIHLSMSTVSPALLESLAVKHHEKGVHLLAAPVSGRPERAKDGALWIFLSGPIEAKNRVEPILKSMSCKIFDLGEEPKQAALFKLCNNFMILSFIESLAEALAMLEKNGIAPEKATEVWGQSLFDAPVMHSYRAMMSQRTFESGGFALKLGLKDMRLLQTCADQDLVPMPILSELHEKLLESMILGREKFDWSGIALLTRERAGLETG